MLTDEEITTVGNQAWHDTLSGGLLNWERVEATSLAVAAAVRAECDARERALGGRLRVVLYALALGTGCSCCPIESSLFCETQGCECPCCVAIAQAAAREQEQEQEQEQV